MKFWRIFERKRPHIRACLNGDGPFYIVPLAQIQVVLDECVTAQESGDRLVCTVVYLRPSDVDALPEFSGF